MNALSPSEDGEDVACAWAADTAEGSPGPETSSSSTSESQKGTARLPEIVVEERSDSLIGIADSSTQGTVGQQQLEERPISRPGEVLETMPGVIVTQHSGDGKANQYFLRGFNLDHGTDMACSFNGIPINLPSNAHGEGYLDLNFLIPELIQKIDYGKGPYFANVGDFGSAGWENIQTFQTLPAGIAKMEVGSWNYERGLLADSTKVGQGNLLGAFELVHTDGPWDVPENYLKYNGILTYSQGDTSQGFSATAMGYHGTWNATNQIPKLAVAEGLIDRFGNLSPTDGGLTDRYTLSAEYHQADEHSVTKIMGYAYYYNMGLWNNFTFFLDDPVHGDQFEQKDTRWVQGVRASRTWFGNWRGMAMENTIGLDIRNDVIHDGLVHTEDRQVLYTLRDDDIVETNLAPYFENKIQWLPWFRTVAGFREDFINFNNKNNFTYAKNGPNPADSG
ncbi:MAG: TonB-dependent receptor, partial [Syntrophobacteraceae bacterium]